MSRRAGSAAEKDFDSGDVSAEMENPLRVAAAPAAAAAESTESDDGRGGRQKKLQRKQERRGAPRSPGGRQRKSPSAKFTRSQQRKKQHTRQARAARWRAGRAEELDMDADVLEEEHRPGLTAKGNPLFCRAERDNSDTVRGTAV